MFPIPDFENFRRGTVACSYFYFIDFDINDAEAAIQKCS